MEMTPEEWDKAKELFDAALAYEPSQRAAFLVQAYPHDNLLKDSQEAGSFLSNSVLHPHIPIPGQTSEVHAKGESTCLRDGSGQPLSAVTITRRDDFLIGRHLGVYELERRIGQGGMAAVFLAARADDEFRRRVAIKTANSRWTN